MYKEKELQKDSDHLEVLVRERTSELLLINKQLKKDVDKRKHVERELNKRNVFLRLHQIVASAANEAHEIEEALKRILKGVCTHTKWYIGHAYVISEDNPDLLEPTAIWFLVGHKKQISKFCDVTKVTKFTKGTGLPGRVMSQKKPQWTKDVTKDPGFVRIEIARAVGIKSGFAFPIMIGRKVVAVLEFFSTEVVIPDDMFMEVMADIGKQLGVVFERKSSEARLKQSEEKLRKAKDGLEARVKERTAEISKLSRAVEQSSCTIIITDVEGNIEYVNPRFKQTSGYTFEEVLGKNPRILNPSIQKHEVYKELWSKISAGNTWQGEFYNKKKNGEHYWELVSISPIKNEEGTITHYVSVQEDITGRKMTESKLKAAMETAQMASDAKSVFLSSMSHELRTPMTAILGYAQLLELNPAEPLSEAQKVKINHITQSGKHLLELINEILDLSIIESGRLQVTIRNIDVVFPIEEAIITIKPIAHEYKINVINLIDHDARLYIKANDTRLRQIFINLLSNAIKYNHADGSVTISCEFPDTDTIRINIEDTGPGIRKNKLGSLFEPFNRLGTETLDIEGSGIGLTITKKLVERMGGNIGVESKVGKGTKFFVDFKKAEVSGIDTHKTEEAQDVRYKHETPSKKTILYVEDNPTISKLIECTLRCRPYIELHTARRARQGIEFALAHQPDLILMDINLPGMDGFEALKVLRSHDDTKEVPVIAISASVMPKDIQKGKRAGFNEYITKPIDINKFLLTIDNVLKEKDGKP